MPDLEKLIQDLVDSAMQKATRVTAMYAAVHHPDYWFHVRDETTKKILALVDEDRLP